MYLTEGYNLWIAISDYSSGYNYACVCVRACAYECVCHHVFVCRCVCVFVCVCHYVSVCKCIHVCVPSLKPVDSVTFNKNALNSNLVHDLIHLGL